MHKAGFTRILFGIAAVAAAASALAEGQGLFVTLDPRRDTQDVLAQYAPAFHPGFIGLRGSEGEVARTAEDFKVFFAPQRPDASGFYTVDHLTAIFVFDPEGRLRLYMKGDSDVDAIVHDVKLPLRP